MHKTRIMIGATVLLCVQLIWFRFLRMAFIGGETTRRIRVMASVRQIRTKSEHGSSTREMNATSQEHSNDLTDRLAIFY